MAKNVFFSEETMNEIGKLAETEHGEAVIRYGKDNFLLGGLVAVCYGISGWVVYKAIDLGKFIWKYLKS